MEITDDTMVKARCFVEYRAAIVTTGQGRTGSMYQANALQEDSTATPDQLLGQIQEVLVSLGYDFGSAIPPRETVLRAALHHVRGDRPDSFTGLSGQPVAQSSSGRRMDLSPYSPSERKLINECLVACSGDVGGALVEAQRRVLNKYRAEGQTTQAAVKKARPLFPNLFMT